VAEYCDELVCLSHLRNYVHVRSSPNLCVSYLWPWLDPPLTVVTCCFHKLICLRCRCIRRPRSSISIIWLKVVRWMAKFLVSYSQSSIFTGESPTLLKNKLGLGPAYSLFVVLFFVCRFVLCDMILCHENIYNRYLGNSRKLVKTA